MQNLITACIGISLFSGVLKLLLQAAGSERTARVIQKISGILIIFTLLGNTNRDMSSFSGSPKQKMAIQFEQLNNETMDSIFTTAEAALGKRLEEELTNRFGITPIDCIVGVDRESLNFSEIQIFYSADSPIFSTYEIKNYINNVYGAKAEVVFK